MKLPWYLKVKKAYMKNGKYMVEIKANPIGLILIIIRQYLWRQNVTKTD